MSIPPSELGDARGSRRREKPRFPPLEYLKRKKKPDNMDFDFLFRYVRCSDILPLLPVNARRLGSQGREFRQVKEQNFTRHAPKPKRGQWPPKTPPRG